MNAKNVPNAMTANKHKPNRCSYKIAAAFLLSLYFQPVPSFAQAVQTAPSLPSAQAHQENSDAPPPVAAAPALSGVNQIVLNYIRTRSNKGAENCVLLPREDIASQMLTLLGQDQINTMLTSQYKTPEPTSAWIDLIPEVTALTTNGSDCISWVALTAQGQNVVRLPPVKTPRNMLITYWRGGLLVASSPANHAKLLTDEIQKLTRAFIRQYKLDQPPMLPTAADEAKKDAIK